MILGFLGTMVPAVAAPDRRATAREATREATGQGDAPEAAWVVFHGQADLPWLRLLRPGFRHCYVVLRSGERWLSLDPLLSRLEVQLHGDLPPDFDLPSWLAGRGHTVIRAVIDRTKTRPAPWRPFTCVEAVKRVLGLHDRFVLTPWQLYRFLAKPASLPSSRAGLTKTTRGDSSWAH